METLAERLFRLREKSGLKQIDVATKVGVSRVAVTKWESGQTENIKLANLTELCKLFCVSYDYLILGAEKGLRQSIERPEYAPDEKKVAKIQDRRVKQSKSRIEEIMALADSMSEPGQWELLGHARVLASMYPRPKANPAN